MKSVVTISRYWNNPQITTTISHEGISIQQDLDDFVSAIKHELGSISLVFTKKEFEKRLDDAVRVAIEKIKEETIKVI